jgi:hypothetical protein
VFVIELVYKADLDQIEQIMQVDPFVAQGLAEVRITQFRASQRAADIPKRIE